MGSIDHDKNTLVKLKGLVAEIQAVVLGHFNDGSIVDTTSLFNAVSCLDIDIDIEMLKLDEYSKD